MHEHLLARWQALQDAGAAGMDPVRWAFMAGLLRRASGADEAVQARLRSRLAQALDAYEGLWHAARDQRPPLARRQPRDSALAQLLRDLPGLTPEAESSHLGRRQIERAPQIAEFRHSLSRLGVQRQVRQALDQAPVNAGPINSHMLALRALQRMHELSPAYLHHFMTQVDSLMCLEAMEKAAPPPKKGTKNRRAASA